jgi:hypothetical protein
VDASVTRRGEWILAAVLLLAFACQCVAFVRANSQTYDEALTLASGALLLRGGPDVDGEHPPLARVLAALPIELLHAPRLDLDGWRARREGGFALGYRFLFEGGVPHEELLNLGRAPLVVLAILLVALVGLFAARLFGARAGLLAFALAAFDPNLVAHGSLASHDAPLALFTTLALFAMAEFFARPRPAMLVLVGIATGLALVTKFSGLLLVVAVVAAFAVQAFTMGGLATVGFDEGQAPRRRSARAMVHAAGNLALVLGLALLVVRVSYGARGYGSYVDGVRAQLTHQSNGHPAFFLGKISTDGWLAYFPVALALKSPPLTLGLSVASIVAFRRGAPFGRAGLAVLLPAAVFLLALLFVRVDVGVRYALPVLPLLIVAAARVATFSLHRNFVVALGLGLLHHGAAAIRIAPHDLAFFSDLAGGASRGRRYLSDSNLDWGQDLGTLATWAGRVRPARLYLSYFGTASPEAYGVVYQPAPNGCPHSPPWVPRPADSGGRGEFLAVSVMNAQGVFLRNHDAYLWLAERTPVADLGHSIAVYDITRDAGAHRALARLYSGDGLEAFSASEMARAAAIDHSFDTAP